MGIFERLQHPANEAPQQEKRTPKPEPVGARTLDTLPQVKSLKQIGDREVPTHSPTYTALRNFIFKKGEKFYRQERVRSPERIKAYTERVKEAYTDHFRRLGVINEGESIQWPEVVELASRRGKDDLGFQVITAFIQSSPVETTTDSLRFDPMYQAVNDIVKARVIAHELYHATGYMSDFVRGSGWFDVGQPKQKGADFAVFRDHILRGRNQESESRFPALEEGAAVYAEVRFLHTILKEEMPNQAFIYEQFAHPEPGREAEYTEDMYISRLNNEDGMLRWTMLSCYPTSFRLVSYLHEHIPDFERLFEGMRLRGNRTLAMSDLRRNVDGKYGVGTWKELLLATEDTADELLEALERKDATGEGKDTR